MGFPKIFSLAILLSLTFFAQSINGQIIFKELPNYRLSPSDSTFLDIGSTRSIISLNGKWRVYPAKDDEKKVTVVVPSIFQGNGNLVFEKHFSLTPEQIHKHKLELEFLGLNYTADISVNGVIIYRHSGGEYPFKFELPRDILHSNKDNILTVKLYYKLDSETTIPLKQRFYFPQNFGGILKDVYIHLKPSVSTSDLILSYNYNPLTSKAKINFFTKVENRETEKRNDTLSLPTQFTLKIKFISPNGGGVISSPDYDFQLSPNKDKSISESLELASPTLWSPSDPNSYIIDVELWSGGNLIDKTVRPLAIYSLTGSKNSFKLNGTDFMLNGVTYVPSYGEYGSLATYSDMENDIRMIKELGFNSVRFAKSVPHPYYLSLCEKYGLLAFIELPINDLPEHLALDPNFISRSKNYLSNYIKAYREYSAVAAIGLGSSYLPQSDAISTYLKTLGRIVKNTTNLLTYASFSGLNVSAIDNIDLYGVELFNTPIDSKTDQLKRIQNDIGAGRVFISEATYVVNIGNSNGYVNDHSFEAQAKYFDDLIDYSSNNPMAGYFINSMFDYRGDYASLTAGYNEDNIYKIGICGESRNTDRIGYKVIYSKLHNGEKVTIPIGIKKDDAPMYFVLYGLLLALLIGVLVNSGRKFREDASRALLRPYNFYADVRDQRIMSGYHSTVLALIVAAISALITGNMLFYFKENIVLEKILLSFGSAGLIKIFSYLAWHPLLALVWLSFFFLFGLMILTVVVKIASFFVKTRVFYSSVYFSIIWSFLPLILLIPVGIVLYRLLSADIANLYLYIGLIIFAVWIFYRLMKGIYVIFDVNSGSVYFYSILLLIVVIGGILLYYQINNSVFDYLQLTFKQYKIFG